MSENKIGTLLRTPIRILLLTFCLYACSDHDKDQNQFRYDTEVIAVFSPYGTTGQTNADLLYRGMIQATDSLGITFRPIFPLTYEEGAEILSELVKDNKAGFKRLIVSTDIEYSDHLRELADNGLVTDSDSTRLLVFDGDFRHQDIYTAHIPYYGMMYKAGYVASMMSDVENIIRMLKNPKIKKSLANQKLLYLNVIGLQLTKYLLPREKAFAKHSFFYKFLVTWTKSRMI